ncbi:hypothetical protein D3C79_881030 [compost metagenome]
MTGLRGVQAPLCLELVHVDAKLLEQLQGQARFYPPGPGVANEVDVTPAHQHFVAVQIDPVVAWQHAIGRQQQLQVDRRLRALQKGGVETLQWGVGVGSGQAGQGGADDQRQGVALPGWAERIAWGRTQAYVDAMYWADCD